MAILVTGATGQIGSELVPALKTTARAEPVVVSALPGAVLPESLKVGPVEYLDATDHDALASVFQKYSIQTIYHLVGILSARGEQDPHLAWETNIQSLKNILDLAVQYRARVFWPSSIAVFGPTTPREHTPQQTVLEPTTMYGVSKVAGELLCNYYYHKYNLDVRSLRFPGIISWKTEPGGGTTDFAVAMYYAAVQDLPYDCFVKADTTLPMMYMDDAIMAVQQLMAAPAASLRVRTSYNLSTMSVSAAEIAASIQERLQNFNCRYKPDQRQTIADSWPQSIDDTAARQEWAWKPKYGLHRVTELMLENLQWKFRVSQT